MVLALCRVGVDATPCRRHDVARTFIWRYFVVWTSNRHRYDVSMLMRRHSDIVCLVSVLLVNVVVSVKVWTSSFLVYSIMRCRIVRERILYTWFTWLFFVMSYFPSFVSCISFRQERTMRGSQWLIKIYILYVVEIKIIQKIIFKLTIKCKC